MATQTTALDVPSAYSIVTSSSDKGCLTFNAHADLILSNPARKSQGRALVCGHNDTLIINYAGDFKGGLQIAGLKTAPAGTQTTDVVIDASGNLYRQS